MERKSAQKGSRSADERSPDRSDKARRDGARSFKSGKSGKFSPKKPGKFGPKKSGGSGTDRYDTKGDRLSRGGKSDGWSPGLDSRRENREERAMRRDGEKPQRKSHGFKDRDDRGARSGRDDKPRFDRSRGSKQHRDRDQSFKKSDRGFDKPRNKPVRDHQRDENKPKGPAYTPPTRALEEGERIAKIMARAGLCSRRDAELWIENGRVSVNGKVLESPAINVHANDKVLVDGEPLPVRERTRLWLYHKPRGLVTTTSDPEGRTTVFEKLPEGLPRVITVGRLDINTEGLLLLTNDGGLARVLELPSTGWLRRYRVRAYGKVTQEQLDTLAEGIALDGVLYGAIDAQIEREQGDNVWITVALREGKNREVKRVLGHLGLDVNRLIRVSYGPFQLLDLEEGTVNEVRGRVLRDQLGERLVSESGADFDAPILTEMPKADQKKPKKDKDRKSSGGGAKGGYLSAKEGAKAVSNRKDRKDGDKKRFDDRGGRDDHNDRRDRRDRDDWSARDSKYAERKPFDPTAPRRTNFAFREEGADGKKNLGRTARRVGGKPQKADLLDPNARLEGKSRRDKKDEGFKPRSKGFKSREGERSRGFRDGPKGDGPRGNGLRHSGKRGDGPKSGDFKSGGFKQGGRGPRRDRD